jgi:hypothetical protein
MPKYIIGNYYTGCVIHEIEADDEARAIQVARDIPETRDEIAGCMQYDETLVLEIVKGGQYATDNSAESKVP